MGIKEAIACGLKLEDHVKDSRLVVVWKNSFKAIKSNIKNLLKYINDSNSESLKSGTTLT